MLKEFKEKCDKERIGLERNKKLMEENERKKENLRKRMEWMERKEEMKERRKKRKNIVIKGGDIPRKATIMESVKKIMKRDLGNKIYQ